MILLAYRIVAVVIFDELGHGANHTSTLACLPSMPKCEKIKVIESYLFYKL